MTQDIRTMPRHSAAFLEEGNNSPGVILIPQTVSAATAIDALILMCAATDADEWPDRILRIPL
jgi:hypothetical protein